VRLYLASALQRIDPAARWPIAAALLQRAEDAGDHNLPTMIWLGVEPLVAGGADESLAHAADSRIPQLARFIARRLVDANRLDPLVAALAREPRTVTSLLDGMRDGLAGRTDVTAPAGWPAALARLERSNARVATAASEVARHFGDAASTQLNLATVRDWTAPMADRRRALVVLATQRRAALAAELPALIDVPQLRVDAIRAVAAFDSAALGKVLLSRYAALSDTERGEALQSLSSRASYGRLLTDAIEAGTVPRRDVPPHIARQLRRVVGTRFTTVWGPVEPNRLEDHVLAKYRTLLTDSALATADASRGRTVFQRTCASCHQLYGEGGTIGPDLTGSNRANLDYLLLNLLDPSGDVPEAYRLVVITTRDGRTYSGNVVTETERQVTLRTVSAEPVLINTADIQSRDVTSTSLMPSGLLDALTDVEVLDLVAYLRTTVPAVGR
jgi:putative heme-binding domain-containing protein